jgi:hypothetical protein
MRLPASLLIVAVMAIATAASARSLDSSTLCVDGVVDRLKLADMILDETGVTRAVQALESEKAKARGLPTDELVFLDRDLCKGLTDACTKDDEKTIVMARGHLVSTLDALPKGVSNPNALTFDTVFTDTSANLVCEAKSGTKNPGKTTAPSTNQVSPLRVRGTASSFYLGPKDQGYDGVTKATASLQNDGVAHKETEKLILFLGVDYSARPFLDFIPYVGIDQEFSQVKGKAASISNNFWDLGIQGAYLIPSKTVSQGFNVRPDYLTNMQDHSRIASLNLVYAPYVSPSYKALPPLNSYIGTNKLSPIQFQPVFELHLDAGHYTDRGTANMSSHLDFNRLGPKYGAVVKFDTFPGNPMILTVTDVHLFRLSGAPKDLDYLSSDLSIPLGDSKVFSLDLTYSNGRREDSQVRENLWGVSVGAKY